MSELVNILSTTSVIGYNHYHGDAVAQEKSLSERQKKKQDRRDGTQLARMDRI